MLMILTIHQKQKKTEQLDFNDKPPDKIRFLKLNSYQPISELATAKYYVYQSFDVPKLVRNNKNNVFFLTIVYLNYRI